MTKQVLILPGDGIGPEIAGQAIKVLEALAGDHGLDIAIEHGLLGGAAYDKTGSPLPERTLGLAKVADAVLMGAVGGPSYDGLPREFRPERGLLQLRSALGLFANLRPAIVPEPLIEASSLRPERVAGLDILIVRELTGGIYFGEPRGFRDDEQGRVAFNTMIYSEAEIERLARVGFEAAARRRGRVCSVDKANVLEVSELWREVVTSVAADYPGVALSHMYVDNAAMQLVKDPRQFDVIVTGNLFGDILSDIAAMLTGSIGMLPSASLGASGRGLYEPVHGAAPDIAGQDKANPLAMILSVAMMLRHSLDAAPLAQRVEQAVTRVLAQGLRTADIAVGEGGSVVGTQEMGDAVVAALRA